MMNDIKPYPDMKDSGVQWLGAVPGHWGVRKLRGVLRNVADRNQPDLPLLSVVREKGVILRDVSSKDENHNFIPDDLTNYKVVRTGQFAMNKMKAWQGSYGISQHDGIVSPAYFVFDLDGVQGDFFHTAIRSKIYVSFFTQASDGVRIGQWDLSQARMREIAFFVPPLPEQKAIVRYLDYVDRRIQRYVAAKKKLIALLEEQKQAIIHRAVTRGLDPDAPLKNSGVEWLGEVPRHWEVAPAKHFYREIDERSKTGEEELLSVSHITGVTSRSQKNITMFLAESYVGYKLCRPDDLVINTMWAWMGALGVSRQLGIVSYSYGVYRPFQHSYLLSDYADLLLRTRAYVDEYICRSTGIHSSRLRLYPEQFLRIRVVCPPLEEQKTILEHIAHETEILNSSLIHTHRQIQLLQEYRARLIADVVTGKLDVRAAVAGLPEEEPIDGLRAFSSSRGPEEDPFDIPNLNDEVQDINGDTQNLNVDTQSLNDEC